MIIWYNWLIVAKELRPVFSRERTFLWFLVCLIGFSIRSDLYGVTSFVRAIGLKDVHYNSLLVFFHTDAVCIGNLTKKWVVIVFKYFPMIVTFNGRPVLVGDGIKVAKSGKKMPGVKLLHQESDSNTKPEYITGHSFQAVGLLCGTMKRLFSVPLVSRIHEGTKFTPKDKRTLLDKMIDLLEDLAINRPCYFVADAYYASKKIVAPLLEKGWDLITRVRSNAVAYFPPTEDMQPKHGGRRRTYGKKIKLRDLAKKKDEMKEVKSPVYGEEDIFIRYLSLDLLWRPIGKLVRFVIVVHPTRGTIILMGTDLELSPLDIIKIYGYRFKIEVSFKQILRTIGGYGYHFWMRNMVPRKRKDGDKYLHRTNQKYRDGVKRKIKAYHLYVQTGIIAQGLMIYLAVHYPTLVWNCFGSWMRTMNIDTPPSEFVTSHALKNTFEEFLLDSSWSSNLKKFILNRIDFSRNKRFKLSA